MITGPLGLNWSRPKWGVFPRLENAELSGVNPPTPERLRLWTKLHVHVPGRPDWCILKLHTHGWVPANRDMLFGPAMQEFHTNLSEISSTGNGSVHYVSARELFNIVSAAAEGRSGDPNRFRDHVIGRPSVCSS